MRYYKYRSFLVMNISRIAAFLIPFLLGSACSASAASVKSSRAAEPKRPNIILFLVDDMGWQDTSLPFWREEDGTPKPTFLNKRYRTPNMEALGKQGMVFTNAYAQPICSPSRCSLMSGMNSARHRVTNWTLLRDQTTDAGHQALKAPADWSVNGIQPTGTRASGTTHLPLTEEKIQYRMEKPFTQVLGLPCSKNRVIPPSTAEKPISAPKIRPEPIPGSSALTTISPARK